MLRLLTGFYNFVQTLICVAPFSLPICVVQLLLLRFCKHFYVPLIPAALGGVLFLLGAWVLPARRGYAAVLGLLMLIPALLLLSGSGLGWLIWYVSQKYLH